MRSIYAALVIVAAAATCNAFQLPMKTLNCANYPPLHTPVVEENEDWTALYDLKDIPDIAPNNYPDFDKDGEEYEDDICERHLPDACNAECGCQRDEIYGCKNRKQWSLTYNWAPNPFTPDILENLRNAGSINGGVKGTFFIIGSSLCDDEGSKAIIDAINKGHEIGITSWSYTRLSALTTGRIIAEIKWTEEAVFELTGIKPKYLRPPEGNMDDRVRFIIKAMGYTAVMWTPGAETMDWKYMQEKIRKREEGTKFITERIEKYINPLRISNSLPGTISLHYGLGAIAPIADKEVIEKVIDARWRLVPMTTCLQDTSFAQNVIIGSPDKSLESSWNVIWSGSLPEKEGAGSDEQKNIKNSLRRSGPRSHICPFSQDQTLQTLA